jgi:hypothetical protein
MLLFCLFLIFVAGLGAARWTYLEGHKSAFFERVESGNPQTGQPQSGILTFILCPTFKMSHDRGWRGSCCSEHEP